MLKCKVSKRKDVIRVKAKGIPKDLMLETAMVIRTVYEGISRTSPEAATQYKNTLIGVLLDPDSPVWKGE